MTETTELLDKAEIRDGQAIVAYSRTEAAVAELRAKYHGAKYDLTTTAGDKAARAGRLELVTVRAALEKKRKELKAPAIDFGKAVDAKAAELTAEILALEGPIDAQIKADEKRRDDERRVREEAEAARKKVHTDAIAKIAGYVTQAADMPSDRLATGIAYLEGLDLSGFEEFKQEAADTRSRTVDALKSLHIKAKAREDEAARLEAARAEQARVAAEQAETARKLKDQQDELDRQRAAIQAEADRIERERQAQEAADRRAREEAEALERRQSEAPAAPPTATAAPTPAPSPAPAPQVLQMRPAAGAKPTLKLGEINARIAPLSITADGLASLGFTATKERNAALYHEAEFPSMCDALRLVLERARDGVPQAA
jgi:hypothetical protein